MYFTHYGVNPTFETSAEPASTFAVDVDTASFGVARALLARGELPDRAAIRVEDFVNAMDYGLPPAERERLTLDTEIVPSPHRRGYHVLRVSMSTPRQERSDSAAPLDVMFVVDRSEAMRGPRAELSQGSLQLWTRALGPPDRVGLIVVTDRVEHVAKLDSPKQFDKSLDALQQIEPQGESAIDAGLLAAYEALSQQRRPDATGRVVLLSHGARAPNGRPADMLETIGRHAVSGVGLSVVGVGLGPYDDHLLHTYATEGAGPYAFIDTVADADAIVARGVESLLRTIVSDVRIRVDFDASNVRRYRLLGYESRVVDRSQRSRGGALGPGATVTALYEVSVIDASRSAGSVTVEYQDEHHARHTVHTPIEGIQETMSDTTRLAIVAAALAEKLRGSYWVRNLSYAQVIGLADGLPASIRDRPHVLELQSMLRTAAAIDKRGDRFETEVSVADMTFDRVPNAR